MNLPTTKLLFLDTCALVKLFIDEPGHNVLMWLLKNPEAVLGHSVHVMTSVHVRDEFPQAIAKMVKCKQISEADAKGILQRSEGYLNHCFPGRLDIVDTGPLPGFKAGKDTSVDALIRKYGLEHRDRTDCAILASIVNYLRCFGGGSLPHVVTADGDFAKVIKAEGFGVINPEKMSVEQVKAYLTSVS